MLKILKITAASYVALFFLIYVGSWIHIRLGSSKELLDVQNEDGSWDVAWATEGPDVIPKDMKEAIAELEEALSEEELAAYRDYLNARPKGLSPVQEMEFSETYGHMGLGMSMRNSWGLWWGSRLARWLGWRVGWHPDNMSAAILDEFESYMMGNPITNLTGQRLFYLAVWSFIITFPLFALATLVYLVRLVIKRISNRAAHNDPISAPH